MLLEGINIQEIARRLGRSKIEITWNPYAHLYPREEERAIEILNEIVQKSCKQIKKPLIQRLFRSLSKPHEKDILGVLAVGIELSQPKQVGSERETL